MVIIMIERFLRTDYLGSEDISSIKKPFNGTINPHWHEFYEIEYVISGTGTYTIDGENYKIEPGMLFFMTPVNFHAVKAENMELYNISFSSVAVNSGYLAAITDTNFPTAFKLAASESKFMVTQFEEMAFDDTDISFKTILLNSVFAKLLKRKSKYTGKELSPLSYAKLYIINKFRDNISLSDVAKYAGFSPAYFSSAFKKETGKTFKEYITDLKFEYALKLLKHTDFTVLQICNDSGFEDYSNFLRRFKIKYGVSPQQYRNGIK